MSRLTGLLIACLAFSAEAFSGLHVHDLHDAALLLQHSGSAIAHKVAATYSDSLTQHPLLTKMATGGTLATAGDAIAQSQTDEPYDKRRAFSFMTFDMCYRATQHYAFPVIVAACHGQYLGELLNGTPLHISSEYLAAMEQTLASQLGIVPFMYYPVFYVLTAIVQNLNRKAAVNRAKETFLPLMAKNLKFWIPVQFVQFGFIDEQLQIPFLSAAGLCWTFILSVAAGSTKSYANEEPPVNVGSLALEETDEETVSFEGTSVQTSSL